MSSTTNESFDLATGVKNVLGEEVTMLVRAAHNLDKVASRLLDSETQVYGISQTQSLFVIFIASQGDDPVVYQSTLEKKFGLTNPTVTSSVRSLVRKGIVRRVQDPDDGRYYRLYLTEEGKSLYEPCVELYARAERELRTRLTDEECDQLLALLNKATGAEVSSSHASANRSCGNVE